MDAVRRWNSRRRSPSFRSLREAGPPTTWLVIAGFVGVAAVIVLFLAGMRNAMLSIATPLVAFTLACLADRDGWRIRLAIGELAALQRQRWTHGRVPADPMSAEAWLATQAEAPVPERVSALITAGRSEDARALIAATRPATPDEAVGLERLRLTIDAGLAGRSSGDEIQAAFEALPDLAVLPADEQRYQRLALAWSMAWLPISRRQPWRDAFARAIRPLGPFRPPLRYRLFHVTQHYALPIAYGLAWLIVSWAGLGRLLE